MRQRPRPQRIPHRRRAAAHRPLPLHRHNPQPRCPDRPTLDPFGHHQISGPGDRAPHVRLIGAPGIESTLDLLGPPFTLLTSSDHPAWQHQAATAAAAGIPITIRAINTGSQHEAGPQRWHTRCGIPTTGAVLVRPDGHIAWTAPHPPKDKSAELLNVLQRILGNC